MEPKQILLGIVVVIILFVLYYYFFTDNTSQNLITLKDAIKTEEIGEDKIENSANFSYSLWIFLKDYNYNYGKTKYVFFRPTAAHRVAADTSATAAAAGTDTASASISLEDDFHYNLHFGDYDSSLIFKIRTVEGDQGGSGTASQLSEVAKYTSCTLKNIPLQKWTHVLISVRNKTLDMYLDGKLEKTCVSDLPYMLPEEAQPLMLCPSQKSIKKSDDSSDSDLPGFRGFMGTFMHYTRAIQPREAYAIYKEGYGGGGFLSDLLNKYKLKIAFMENSKELNSILI